MEMGLGCNESFFETLIKGLKIREEGKKKREKENLLEKLHKL